MKLKMLNILRGSPFIIYNSSASSKKKTTYSCGNSSRFSLNSLLISPFLRAKTKIGANVGICLDSKYMKKTFLLASLAKKERRW